MSEEIEDRGFVRIIEEYKNPNELVCNECGGTNVITRAWVNANTLEYDHSAEEDYDWCKDCQDESYPITREEWDEKQVKDEI